MPQFSKEALSQYIRTECKRQLRLYLSPHTVGFTDERNAQQMPPPQQPRPGLEHITQAGEKWQGEKLHDLTQTFGPTAIVGDSYTPHSGQVRYRNMPLQDALRRAAPDHFLVEAEFDIERTFEAEQGIAGYRAQFNLVYAGVRPDLIEVLPPSHFSRYVTPAGEVEDLPALDTRLQLRVIDIKLTAEPSPSYFAEVTYYTIALACWLVEHRLERQFVVVPDGAVWPGSHAASHLAVTHRTLAAQGITPSSLQLREALEEDLEQVPYEVFAFRLRHFLQEDLREVLSTSSWQTLAWHVDNRCKGCEYLGSSWHNAQGQFTNHPDHCMPMAQRQDHLSRVAFISRGASIVLQDQHIGSVSSLAHLAPTDPIYDMHQVLRATRTVVSSRANVLRTGQAHIAPSSGTSAVMPKWSDLHIYLSADFDLGSAITFAFGLKAFWLEPRPFGSSNTSPRNRQSWGPFSFVVDQKDLQSEQRELLAFLNRINAILASAQHLDPGTTVQFYLWDTLQYDHLTRVIGRHLQAILREQTIQHLAWLFPSEELLPNYALMTRKSPITLVREVVRTLLAAPIPHYYSLLDVARIYHDPQLPPNIAQFSVHPLFEDTLSDQIPSERAHEIWSRATYPHHWSQQLHTLEETIRKRLSALQTVTEQLETDLRIGLSQAAPEIRIGPPQREDRLSFDGQLWYAFAKLNEALSELEVQQQRAMPPHEREARYYSARLVRRLTGSDEQRALAQLNLPLRRGRRVYEMRAGSREVKLREGDFHFALAPETRPGFLDRSLLSVTRGTPLEPTHQPIRQHTRMEDVTAVTVAAIDRDNSLIALDPNRRWPDMLDDLEAHGLANFAADVVLDPVYHDYFTKKLRAALRAIGNPPVARSDPLVRQATGQMTRVGSQRTRSTPPANLLWDAPSMYATRITRNLSPVRTALVQHGLSLNTTQWAAWEGALSRRLQLVWGPPGTGKSRTARAVVVGAVLEAHQQHTPMRVLVCASTYTAIDNVLLSVYADIQALLPPAACELYRMRSYLQPANGSVPPQIDLELNKRNPTQQVTDLRARLKQASGITVVGTTPEQIYNLLVINDSSTQDELFDLILIDEASQMDMAHAILALCSLATNGSVILAGDPKQLPPIHRAEAPLGLETMVGSIYTFCEQFHRVPPEMLEENYRSNSTIVELEHHAGYRSGLISFSPDMRLHLLTPLPMARPSNWPNSLYWTPAWSALLDPDDPVVCFVYPEGRSSQWNQFEADAVASLIHLLYSRLADQLLNENDPVTGNQIPVTTARAYSPTDFWQRAVGVVTPHRAQQGLIISRLQEIFAGTGVQPSLIRDAVDTVERFQGQERDVILASFAVGDPDTIQNEDEFLMSLNRFNVMASRPRVKLILFVSRQIVDHLSSDLDTLRESRLLKLYVDSFCRDAGRMDLGFLENGLAQLVPGRFKRRH